MNVSKLSLSFIFLIALSYTAFAFLLTQTTTDDAYFTTSNVQLPFYANVSTALDENITKAELYHNINGTYKLNQTLHFVNSTGKNISTSFNLSDVPDDTDFKWSISVYSNTSSTANTTTNRTGHVEYAPVISYILPTDANISQSQTAPITFNVTKNASASTAVYQCYLFTNETGVWLNQEFTEVGSELNHTFSHFWPEKLGMIYNIRCDEKNLPLVFKWAGANRTLSIGATSPTITNGVAEGLYTRNNSLYFNWTISSTVAGNCNIYHNTNGSWNLNFTNNYNSNANFTKTITTPVNATGQQTYVVGLKCNTTTGLSMDAVNVSFISDNEFPRIENLTNSSVGGTCRSWMVYWNTSETTYGNITYNYTGSVVVPSDGSNGTRHKANFTFDIPNQDIWFNVTACDLAGNCNRSTGNKVFKTPLPVCNGYSAYAMRDYEINMSTVQTQSGADIIYYFNASNQGNPWVTYVSGASAHAGYLVTNGSVVWLYTSVNKTWNMRNAVTDAPALGNFTFYSGNNFVGFLNNRTAYNITKHLNASFIFMAAYNNTDQSYKDFGYNFTWNNKTTFQRGQHDAVWIYSPKNITWNRTDINNLGVN